jgi:phage gpG-like protein
MALSDKDFENALWRDLVQVANKYGRECTKVISKERTWQGYEGARDIVDTGQLRASQKIDYTRDKLAIEVSYNTEYAAAVHNGATIRYNNGNTRRIPPRPWMKIAKEEMKLEKVMEDEIVKTVKKYIKDGKL